MIRYFPCLRRFEFDIEKFEQSMSFMSNNFHAELCFEGKDCLITVSSVDLSRAIKTLGAALCSGKGFPSPPPRLRSTVRRVKTLP